MASPVLLASALFVALLACGNVAHGQTFGKVRVKIQFDNTDSRVGRHQDVIIKYIAERLCKVPFTNVAYVQGSLVNEGNLVNHQSSASYDCTSTKSSTVVDIITRATGKGPLALFARHELRDEIKDHTTPDIEVQKIISAYACTVANPCPAKIVVPSRSG